MSTTSPLPPEPSAVGPFLIGEWHVLPSLGRMVRGDRTAALRRRVMHVLVCLASRRGAVVTREELLETVWEDVVIAEEGLTVAISELRRLFEDDPRDPRYIETIRKSGYRIAAPLCFDASGEAPSRPARDATHGRPRARRRVAAVAAVTGVGVLALVAGGPWLRQALVRDDGRRALPAVALAGSPFTADPGSEIHPAISPDGTRVAFAWNRLGQENLDIYVQQVGANNPLQLTHDPAPEHSPTWSPDGTHVAFVRSGDPTCLYSVAVLGGAPARLLRVDGPVHGLDWSARDSLLAFATPGRPGDGPQVHLLSLRTLEMQPLTGDAGEYQWASAPAFSPDGRAVAFVGTGDGLMQDVFIIPTSGGTARRLTHAQRRVNDLDWMPDGRSLVFSAAPGGAMGLWRISASGKDLTWMPTRREGAVHPSVSSRGDRLVYEEVTVDYDIWSIPLRAGPRTNESPGSGAGSCPDAAGPPAVRVQSTRGEFEADFSPDGERIAFVSDRSGPREIWVAQRDGAQARAITQLGGAFVQRPRWSPDGTRIAFSAVPAGRAAIFVVEVEGGPSRRIGDPAQHEILDQWSRDGRWLYFERESEGGWEIRRMRPDGSDPQVVVPGGHTLLREDARTGELLHSAVDAPGVWSTPAGGGSTRCLLDGETTAGWKALLLVRSGAFFTRGVGPGTVLGFYDFDRATADTLAHIPCHGGRTLALSPDGDEILLDGYQRIGSDVMLVEGFH